MQLKICCSKRNVRYCCCYIGFIAKYMPTDCYTFKYPYVTTKFSSTTHRFLLPQLIPFPVINNSSARNDQVCQGRKNVSTPLARAQWRNTPSAFIVSAFRHYKRNGAVWVGGREGKGRGRRSEARETDSITVAERRDNWDQD